MSEEQFARQFAPVTRLYENLVTRGGATRYEAYEILVRRFPEAMRAS